MLPDWELVTPHDMEAERVLAAFGASVGCHTLADRALPAVRWLAQEASRRTGFHLRRTVGSWRVADRVANCC